MNNGNTAAASGGIGIFGLMFIALFVGKIFEIGAVASWSWWIITMPLWGPTAFFFGIVLVIVTFAFLFGLTAKLFGK